MRVCHNSITIRSHWLCVSVYVYRMFTHFCVLVCICALELFCLFPDLFILLLLLVSKIITEEDAALKANKLNE